MNRKIQEIFDKEIDELVKLKNKEQKDFENVIDEILKAKGKVVIIGVGKTGIIGKKLFATLSSTGTESMFLNANEGLHGDLGCIGKEDITILISNSGSSDEIISVIPTLNEIGVKKIAMTGNLNSKLAKACDYVIDVGVEEEACPLNLAPTTSTTATLVMCDVIAITLMERRGFTDRDFALYHPNGSLGRKLNTRIKDFMVPLKSINKVNKNDNLKDILSNNRFEEGVVFVEENENILGILTDGDIRRLIKEYDSKFFDLKVEQVMNKDFLTLHNKNIKLYEVLDFLENKKISFVPILEEQKIVGIVTYKDIYKIFK